MNRTLTIFSTAFIAAHAIVPAVLALFIRGPIYFNDYALMIYFQSRALEFFGAFQNFWGFDPFFAAGYPLNFTWNSNLFLQFLSVLFHPLPEYVVLTAATVASIVVAPPLFWFGLKNFGLAGNTRRAAMILITAYWWCGLPSVLMLIGMPTSLFVFHLSFFTASLYYRFLGLKDIRVAPHLYILTPLCFVAHKTALLLLGAPALALFLIHIRYMDFKRLAHLAGISALVLTVNSFWLLPFLELVKYKVTLAEAPHGLCYDPLRIFKDYFTLSKIMGHRVMAPDGERALFLIVNTIVRNALLFFGIWGMISWKRSGRGREAAFFAALTIFFLALGYFGSFWSFTALFYPTRYIGYVDLLLAVPAAAGLSAAWASLGRSARMKKFIAAGVFPALLALFVSSLLYFVIFFRLTGTRLDRDTVDLTSFLTTATTPNGRVLLEDSGWNDRDSVRSGAPPKYGESHFPSLLPHITGREFIGGPYPYVFLLHHYADFHDGLFLKKPLSSYSIDSLLAELDRYHIRWVVCWSGDCNTTFSSSPVLFKHLKKIGKFDMYERTSFNDNPFVAGEGFIVTDISGINCWRVRPEQDRVILKYHWFDKLESRGGGVISRIEYGADPAGFIEVKNPPRYFRITNGYDRKIPQ